MPEDSKPPQSVEDLIRGLGTDMAQGFQALGLRIGRLEPRLDELEAWRQRTSLRVGAVASTASNADLAQEAKIADEIVSRQALEKKVDTALAILTRLDGFASKPLVRYIAGLVGLAIVAWLTAHGQAPQVIQQVAPAPTAVHP